MSEATVQDYADIIATLNVYVEGGNTSGAMTKQAFHPNATVNAEPAQGLYEAIDQAGKGDSIAKIDVLDVVGDVATARVTMENWHGENFVDFHLLMKGDDGWKIVAKVFHTM
ncbi:nuclear transport factor 2 family protein [Furfurilactobacillus siliginis]|uniref:Lumazine-binding protein n=1 Tax=Furfurilactobacillus siliginis TaxID=348151 RepID=A0A0R2L8N8_9LACO|nr:nuclear transport factor 2 family protein [Furfurilactobacillus siliginis]KRN95482.1 hypothetical protein IV55_GL001943 [Furfurilactobacillus siliginis]GEK28256.1 hypothetical protein LSI01_05670 [Furfurilactobacillus siliginis]